MKHYVKLLLCVVITSLLFFSCYPLYAETFAEFLQQLKTESLAQGIQPDTVNRAFKDIQYLHHSVFKDKHQTAVKETLQDYLAQTVSEARIQQGQEKYKTYKTLLEQIYTQYKVPPQYLLALWGLETNYGRFMGDTPVLSALATLSYDKRRNAFFKKQFFAALRMLDEHMVPLQSLYGSWAGAMGQCQFMPTNYLAYAVSFDDTAQRHADIWNHIPDVLASIANFLKQEGWQAGAGVVYPVTLTRAIPARYLGIHHQRPLATWKRMGIKWDESAASLPTGNYSLLLAAGEKQPAYLVYSHNFAIIHRWNRSISYALAVGLLANKIIE